MSVRLSLCVAFVCVLKHFLAHTKQISSAGSGGVGKK